MRPTAQQVIAMVAEAYGFTPDDLCSRNREGRVVNARAIATYLLMTQLILDTTETSEILHRDKESVIRYFQTATYMMQWSTMFRRDLDILVGLSWKLFEMMYLCSSGKRPERHYRISFNKHSNQG